MQPRRQQRRVRGFRALVPVLLAGAALSACGGVSTAGRPATAAAPPTAPASPVISSPGAAPVSRPGRATTPAPAGAPAPQAGTWEIVVYYTPVESFHHGALQAITGCGPETASICGKGTTPLGSYPADFLQAVKDQDDGRITSGSFTGRYLSWDDADGWSIGDAALEDSGRPMRAFVTAAANAGIPQDTRFKLLSCGVDTDDGSTPDPAVCARLMAADWIVGDSTGDPAGTRVVNLYVGEEIAADFESTPLVIDDVNARTSLP